MVAPGWLSQRLGEVPSGERWLSARERRALPGMSVARRRNDWVLGRWTAKAAVSTWLGVTPERIEILAAADGAPEAWIDGERAPVSVSLSHRGGRAIAAVADLPQVAGCDLELIEPRSEAFVREWLAPVEQRQISARSGPERALLANLLWTAKEAAAKVRREGLRLDVRGAVVIADLTPGSSEWRRLRVEWPQRAGSTAGWWRSEPHWVSVVAGEPAPERPRALDIDGSLSRQS